MTEAVRVPYLAATDDLDPSKPQHAASDPSASVWVNASAGSGKTKVLTDRVLRLLLDGVKPQKILCLTFTRAAAAEMANRVTGRLESWATCDDATLDEELFKLQGYEAKSGAQIRARRLFAEVLACPGGLRIRTIHAFCQEVLRRFPVEAGLPPHFAVIEENDAYALQEDVRDELLRETAKDETTALAAVLKILVCDLGERGFDGAMQSLLNERSKLNAAITEAGSLEKLIASIRGKLELKSGETFESVCRDAVRNMPEADIRGVLPHILQSSDSFAAVGEGIRAWLELSVHQRTKEFEAYYGTVLTKEGEPRKHYANKKILDAHPEIDGVLYREAARLQSVLEKLDAVRIAENTAAVLTFGLELARRYDAHKNSQAVLDYEDLIIRTNALLYRAGIAPWVLYKLDGGLDHLLVDEAQDTSRAQWAIVEILINEFYSGLNARSDINRTLFVVGDEKQSIYSFQKADPEAFIEMHAAFTRRLSVANKELKQVELRTSFRSAPAILQAVDAVFSTDAARKGVSQEPVSHRAYHKEKVGRVEIWKPVPVAAKDEAEAWALPGDYEDEQDPQAELAAQIAAKIEGWIRRKEAPPGTTTPITPGDIMILLRRRGRFADLMVRALKNRNVDVTGVDRMKLVKQLPVMDMLALLQFVLLPEDDLNLASLLRSPLLNASEEQLMELAIGRGNKTLWQSLAEKAHDNALFAALHEYLLRWLNLADFTTPFALLARVLNQPCPGSDISGRHALWSRLGPDALDPIEELLNAAQNFSHRRTPSLQNFLQWLMATETEIKRELDTGGSQVRIMTVHASKGLEAPIVFLPDATGVPRTQDIPKFLWSGDGIPFYIARKPSSGVALALWVVARDKQMEEYRRLLYVALTRAANQLYIAGWEAARKEPDSEGSWYNLAANALGPKHQPHFVQNAEPPPDIVIADPVLKPAKTKQEEQEKSKVIALPGWALIPAAKEALPPQPVSPSKMAQIPTATPDKNFARGRIIHRLLQSLPDIVDARRDEVAAKFLANPQHGLTPEQQAEIQKEVLAVLRDTQHAALFGTDSRAEVALAGHAFGQDITGQVDRLCMHGDQVWILDYKTNRPPPHNPANTPTVYRQQLAAYRAVLHDVYPGKTIRCFLLWTYGPYLMEIPDGLLTAT